jgi:hypothetical protein
MLDSDGGVASMDMTAKADLAGIETDFSSDLHLSHNSQGTQSRETINKYDIRIEALKDGPTMLAFPEENRGSGNLDDKHALITCKQLGSEKDHIPQITGHHAVAWPIPTSIGNQLPYHPTVSFPHLELKLVKYRRYLQYRFRCCTCVHYEPVPRSQLTISYVQLMEQACRDE